MLISWLLRLSQSHRSTYQLQFWPHVPVSAPNVAFVGVLCVLLTHCISRKNKPFKTSFRNFLKIDRRKDSRPRLRSDSAFRRSCRGLCVIARRSEAEYKHTCKIAIVRLRSLSRTRESVSVDERELHSDFSADSGTGDAVHILLTRSLHSLGKKAEDSVRVRRSALTAAETAVCVLRNLHLVELPRRSMHEGRSPRSSMTEQSSVSHSNRVSAFLCVRRVLSDRSPLKANVP